MENRDNDKGGIEKIDSERRLNFDEFFENMANLFVEKSKESSELVREIMSHAEKEPSAKVLHVSLYELLSIVQSQEFFMSYLWIALSILWNRKDSRHQNIELLNKLIEHLFSWKDEEAEPVIKWLKDYKRDIEEER